MARWKALPDGLDPAVVQLVVELRRIKDDSGLSQSRLAERTGYSDSSWERYLNGRALAPRAAVEALVAVGAADPVTVTVLYDAAEEAWRSAEPRADAMAALASVAGEKSALDPAMQRSTSGTEADVAVGSPDPVRSRIHSLPSPQTVVNSLISALAGAAVALLVAQPWSHSSGYGSATPTKPVSHPVEKPTLTTYPCHFTQVDGKWYAGNSTTDKDLVIYGENGPETAEIQCLLQHAGISVGAIDGVFGHLTLRAVIQEQVAKHLDIDGQVGPQTWAALRG